MKQKLVLIALAVALAASFSGYAEKRTKKAKINFKTEATGNFECTNFSDSDLILFAGKIERNFILGGIKSNETRSFDFSKISGMPKQGAFIMRAVPYETYKTKGRLSNDDAVYTKLAVYNLNSKEKSKTDIYSADSYEYGFIVDNETPFVVELRINDPQGVPIAALPPHCNGLKVYSVPDVNRFGNQIFPTYIYAKDEKMYAFTGGMRDTFRLQMVPINDAFVYRINTPHIEGIQGLESVSLFGE